MAFVQVIEFNTADIDAIRQIDEEWRRATEGKRTVRREILARDRWYFFAHATTLRIDLSGQNEYERRELLDYRWWTAGELEATSDLVFPVGLAGLVPRLLAGDRPAEPIRLPWG